MSRGHTGTADLGITLRHVSIHQQADPGAHSLKVERRSGKDSLQTVDSQFGRTVESSLACNALRVERTIETYAVSITSGSIFSGFERLRKSTVDALWVTKSVGIHGRLSKWNAEKVVLVVV